MITLLYFIIFFMFVIGASVSFLFTPHTDLFTPLRVPIFFAQICLDGCKMLAWPPKSTVSVPSYTIYDGKR